MGDSFYQGISRGKNKQDLQNYRRWKQEKWIKYRIKKLKSSQS